MVKLVSILLLFAVQCWGASYYVATNGTAGGTGAIGDPWNLQTAVSNAAGISPGDKILLRSGTYTNPSILSVMVNGTIANPVWVQSHTNEWAKIVCGLAVRGSNSYLFNLEVAGTDTGRYSTQSTTFPTDIYRRSLDVYGYGTKLLNLVVHDLTDSGIGAWSTSSEVEINGCVIYWNGWEAPDLGHGHGVYGQNSTNSKTIKNNIFYGQMTSQINLAGSGAAYVNNFTVSGNTAFNGGVLSSNKSAAEIYAFAGQMTNLLCVSNVFFKDYYSASTLQLGSQDVTDVTNVTLRFVWNTCYATLHPSFWTGMIVASNQMMKPVAPGNLFKLVDWGEGSLAGSTWNRNNYYNNGDGWQWNSTNLTFAAWKSASGADANATDYAIAQPATTQVFVRSNDYAARTAHVTVLNWPTNGTVDLGAAVSAIVPRGSRYFIRSVEDYFGAGLGGYNSGTITLPLTNWPVGTPVGFDAPTSALPKFGAFVIAAATSAASRSSLVSVGTGVKP